MITVTLDHAARTILAVMVGAFFFWFVMAVYLLLDLQGLRKDLAATLRQLRAVPTGQTFRDSLR